MGTNGVYIVQGELNAVVAFLRRAHRWPPYQPQLLDEQDPLLRNFADLRDVLNEVNDLADMTPNTFLEPFLNVIRSEHTSGPVTGQALASVGKFLSYGLIHSSSITAASAVENIADAVTHARFVGTDTGSDEVVLLKILQVLRTLLLTPVGSLLTNESVCEIMQSCFRICFETRLSEILRKAAEYTLSDMIQLLFTRLPTFKEDPRHPYIRKLKMRTSLFDPNRVKRRKKYKGKGSKSTTSSSQVQKSALKQSVASTDSIESAEKPSSEATIQAEANSELESASRDITNDPTQSSLTVEETNAQDGQVNESAQNALPSSEIQREQPTTPDEPHEHVVDLLEGKLAGFASDEEGRSDAEMVSPTSEIQHPSQSASSLVEPFNPDHQEESIGAQSPDSGIEDNVNAAVGAVVAPLSTATSDNSVPEEAEKESQAEECADETKEGSNSQSQTGIGPSPEETEMKESGAVDGTDMDQHSSGDEEPTLQMKPRVNQRGVRFTVEPQSQMNTGNNKEKRNGEKHQVAPHIPYGLPCIRELFRFLISLTNPLDKQNTEQMIQMGLNLLTVGLEGGADYLGSYSVLMPLVKNELCRSIFLLLQTDKLPVFSSALRVCFLLFEALRTHLKFQLEMYLSKLMDTVVSESGRISFEQKEMALEALVQLWRIPGLVTELYLNYDCDLYCSNLFEDITKLLSKNAFPVTGLYSTHILSLDALLTVVDTIESNCHYRMMTHKDTRATSDASTTSTHSHTPLPNTTGEDGVSWQPHPLPAASGFVMGQQINSQLSLDEEENQRALSTQQPAEVGGGAGGEGRVEEALQIPQVRPNRMPISDHIPSHEDLISQKKKKRLLTGGTELFNQSPSKGIAYLQENGLLQTPLVPEEIIEWLKENPRLNKNKIADYICSRKNAPVLAAFVKSFNFEGVRIDDALRMFLEAFRLPGEAAEISMVIEHFSDHWHTSNDEPFTNTDAAFTLSYAIIMLNVDQWNTVAKKQQPPMTAHDFKRNVSGVNGGADFDHEMLDEIYHAIRQEEIVMPAEQTGIIRENYLWKVLLRRGASKDGEFIHAPSGLYDHDLFGLIWGPTIAALSFVFDKSDGESILQKSMSGFRKCSAIAAHYGMSDVYDNLIISLCKFSGLMASSGDMPEHLPISFGENLKAHMAAKVMFQLVHNHGDILREGWQNILDCLLQLYRAKMLPKTLTEVEDFVDAKGWVSLIREPVQKLHQQKSDTGLLSSLVLILGGSSADTREAKGPTPEEQEHMKVAHSVINECHPEQLVVDSKYLTSEALAEFLKAIVRSSAAVSSGTDSGRAPVGGLSESAENAVVFYLELMITIALENRDRLGPYWKTIRGHFFSLLSDNKHNPFVVERAVVGVLRLAIRLLFRDDISDEVLQSLGLLQLLRPATVLRLSQEITFGLHELLRTNAANIHRRQHWTVLFTLLEAAGASAFPDALSHPHHNTLVHSDSMHNLTSDKKDEEEDDIDIPSASDVDRGYTSDSEIYEKVGGATPSVAQSASVGGSGEWMYVQHGDGLVDAKELNLKASVLTSGHTNKFSIVLRPGLKRHEPKAFLKACETLAFLVRDMAHITPENLESCIQCLRTFVEASLDGGRYAHLPKPKGDDSPLQGSGKQRREKKFGLRRGRSHAGAAIHESRRDNRGDEHEEDGGEEEVDNYHQVSHQLIDLSHTLHVKAKQIFQSWASASQGEIEVSNGALWHRCWRPLLQCMARLCCDCRRQIRTYALNYLQRAFLVHDLQSLSPEEWEDCFTKVLFPLLAKLLDNISPMDPLGMEETRVRTMALLCKVFLQHLSPLSSLPTFNALWLTILDFMERYLHTERSDLLSEAIPESLKNMLLVMETTTLFHSSPGLYALTQDRLASFLPHLLHDVLPQPPPPLPTPTHTHAVGPHVSVEQGSVHPGSTDYELTHSGDSSSEVKGGSEGFAVPPTLPDTELGLEEVVIHSHSPPPPPVPHPPSQPHLHQHQQQQQQQQQEQQHSLQLQQHIPSSQQFYPLLPATDPRQQQQQQPLTVPPGMFPPTSQQQQQPTPSTPGGLRHGTGSKGSLSNLVSQGSVGHVILHPPTANLGKSAAEGGDPHNN